MQFILLTALLGLFTNVFANPIIVGYYPTWKSGYMSGVDFSKYTHINIAFALPQGDGSVTFEGEYLMPQVVPTLHGHGAKVLLSVGGWTGSSFFSNIVKNPGLSENLITNLVNLVQTHNLDGIDIDWEYPGRVGHPSNQYDVQSDTANFLTLLRNLRTRLDGAFGTGNKLITLALRVETFDGPNGSLGDVSEFAQVVDFANLMQYDINGSWQKITGPNAPMNYEPGKGMQLSFVSAIEAWTKAGWPAGKLTAGVGFYGRSVTAAVDMSLDVTNQYQPHCDVIPQGDQEDLPWVDPGSGGAAVSSGMWQWKNLRLQGVLSTPATAAAPWVRQWDPVSQTPWLFNPATKVFISYDDPESLRVKVEYAKAKGLAGMMVWPINSDSNGELLGVVRRFCD